MQYRELTKALLAASLALSCSAVGADSKAFSQPLDGLTGEQTLDFWVGRGLFRRLWVTAPSSTQAADGLGPLFNARSCMSCHPGNGRGETPQATEDAPDALVLHVDIPTDDGSRPDPTYGRQLQGSAVSGHAAEHRLAIRYRESPVTLADGTVVLLRQPEYRVEDLGYGPLHPQARLSPRIAPALIGLGLLQAIDEADILALSDPDDADGNGISGRPNRVWSEQRQRKVPGRFGHKAGQPDLDQQIQTAFVTDLGLSVPLFPHAAGDCTERQDVCLRAPHGNTPRYQNLEAHAQVTDLVHFYIARLAAPAARDAHAPDVQQGRKLFHDIGCNSCHTPHHRTASDAPAALRDRDIAPYTDLLLHDLGAGLADNRPEGEADGSEWRTAPLWGAGLLRRVNGQVNYLHDGRARNLLEAILWHGGEAQPQRDAVVALERSARAQLLAFLGSL